MIELVAATLMFAGLAILAAAVFVRGGRTHEGGCAADTSAPLELLQR